MAIQLIEDHATSVRPSVSITGYTFPYDELLDVDDTLWAYMMTYMIDFVMMAAGIVISAVLFARHGLAPNDGCVPFFFLMHALAFGMAPEDTSHTILWPPINIATVVATALWLAIGLSYLAPGNKAVHWIWLGMSVIVSATSAVTGIAIIYDSFLIGTNALLAVVYWLQAVREEQGKIMNALKVLSLVIMLVSTLIQLVCILAVAGGFGEGYENCFKDCQLPNLAVSNCSALVRLVYVVGFVGYGLAELALPSVLQRRLTRPFHTQNGASGNAVFAGEYGSLV